MRTGDAVGGLLNATFGIVLVALRAGYVEMVRASIIGAILANLLLELGVGFLLGLRHRQAVGCRSEKNEKADRIRRDCASTYSLRSTA
jgi:calcium/proton exchanger cax